MKFTLIKDALEYVGGLNQTSKMPCESYNLPIQECKTGQKLMKVEGSTCASCYGAKGLYKLYEKNTLPSQYRHLAAIVKPFWVAAMAFILNKRKAEYFRHHDVGDIQNLSHFVKICELAKACKDTLFWIPTREYGYVSNYVKLGLKIPENLIVRLSAYMVGGKAPLTLASKLGVQTSTVDTEGGYDCPAYKQGGKCLTCRACWDKTIPVINYPLH